MDEKIANKLFDAAVHFAYTSESQPTDELVLSIYGLLIHTFSLSKRMRVH